MKSKDGSGAIRRAFRRQELMSMDHAISVAPVPQWCTFGFGAALWKSSIISGLKQLQSRGFFERCCCSEI